MNGARQPRGRGDDSGSLSPEEEANQSERNTTTGARKQSTNKVRRLIDLFQDLI